MRATPSCPGDTSKPHRFPENAALGLAAVVPRAVTAKFAEDDSVAQPAAATVVHGVADLVRAPPHGKTLATEPDHLRHKRKALVMSLRIERRENLAWTPHLHEVPAVQIELAHGLLFKKNIPWDGLLCP